MEKLRQIGWDDVVLVFVLLVTTILAGLNFSVGNYAVAVFLLVVLGYSIGIIIATFFVV